MTPSEFKAWFDGFTEALSGTPNADQWARIKARVAEINGTPITYPVYVERYRYPWWNAAPDIRWASTSDGTGASFKETYSTTIGITSAAFNSHTAMYTLGQDETKAA